MMAKERVSPPQHRKRSQSAHVTHSQCPRPPAVGTQQLRGSGQSYPRGGCGEPALGYSLRSLLSPCRSLGSCPQMYLLRLLWFPKGSAPPWASARTTASVSLRRSSSASVLQNWSSGNRRCVVASGCSVSYLLACVGRAGSWALLGTCFATSSVSVDTRRSQSAAQPIIRTEAAWPQGVKHLLFSSALCCKISGLDMVG